MIRYAAWALCISTLLLGAGCESANTVRPAYSHAAPTEVELEKITFNPQLNKRAFVDSVYEGDAGGLMRVSVNLHNEDSSAGTLKGAIDRAIFKAGEAMKPKQRGFKYKFTWYDHQGMEIYDPNQGWKRKFLSTKEFTTISALAPNPEAVDWQLTMQPYAGY